MPLFQDADGLPRFWQRRFYGFNVWSEKKKREKLHYMHNNPVKRELVTHPMLWPWSSFNFYFGKEPRLVGHRSGVNPPHLHKAKGAALVPIAFDESAGLARISFADAAAHNV